METRTRDRGASWVPAETFASRLVRLRRELGWNQGEAAARCGLDDGSWSNWERGVSPRRMAEVVAAIHEATGVDRDWLMWGDPDRFRQGVGEAAADPATLTDSGAVSSVRLAA